MTHYRLLTRAEAAEIPGMIDPMPDSLFVVGAVDESGIIAACGVFMALHADPLWIRPDKRKCKPCLLKHLWDNVAEEILRRGASSVEVGMTETNPGQPTESMIERMCKLVGGREIKARFFSVPVGIRAYTHRTTREA